MYTTHMKANNKGRSYHEKVLDARESLWKDTTKREEERNANPIDWTATLNAGKVIYKTSK
jgi:hypothetical protein